METIFGKKLVIKKEISSQPQTNWQRYTRKSKAYRVYLPTCPLKSPYKDVQMLP